MKRNLSLILLLLLILLTLTPVLASAPFPQEAKTYHPDMKPLGEVLPLTVYQMVFTTLSIAFAILHIILFFYFRGCKENLYFSIFLVFYAGTIFFDYHAAMFNGGGLGYTFIIIMRIFMGLRAIFSLRFVYALLYKKVPRQFKYFTAAIVIGTALTLIYTTPNYHEAFEVFLLPVVIISWLEIMRVIYKAHKAKQDGIWLVALGYLFYYGFALMDALMDAGVSTIFDEMENPYSLGTVGFLLTMSVYMARNYARTSQRLVAQEAENVRKSKELEEARQLQLSMLPDCAEGLPGLDICFHMTTAEEVGGDYYDFRVENNGTLILTVGDATGHGMKAGVMVTSVKSIFQTIGNDPDIPGFFKKCTATIKQMKMGNLYMALSVMRFNEGKLLLSSAGMPPIMVLREGVQEVEEITIKAPPLGGFKDYIYRTRELELNAGDVLVAMSDGYPELFNHEDEMLGFDRIKRILSSAPRDSATAMVRHLCMEGDKWRKNRRQDDDITFAVVRFREKGEAGELCQYDGDKKNVGGC